MRPMTSHKKNLDAVEATMSVMVQGTELSLFTDRRIMV